MGANYGFECDRCDYVTQSENDHIITKEGEYLCIPCYEKLIEEGKGVAKALDPQPCPR